ncbi:Type I Polyketide synthases (Type I PKS) [Aspergillus tanneri]|uniref:Type I Polyketide synthases (Type I PKS) n=1 Tax=Aspergillus tanneri TaxID=1220188 RepID=A0A5M9N1E2_9EURO|nr:Type I Polyketide synthases (Type I PKS) [Aspergillus tanneri]KAA8651450.1 Type I Polyketide synthases (Type I PKS) [Aspergillus tanneri]
MSSSNFSRYKLVFCHTGCSQQEYIRILRHLHKQSMEVKFRNLSLFLEESLKAIHTEARRLSTSPDHRLPRFNSILALAASEPSSCLTLSMAVQRALTLVSQIGTYISYYETHSNEFEFGSNTENTILSGYGMGMLAAAAIAGAKSVAYLASVGAEYVKVAFRLGIVTQGQIRAFGAGEYERHLGVQTWYCAILSGHEGSLQDFVTGDLAYDLCGSSSSITLLSFQTGKKLQLHWVDVLNEITSGMIECNTSVDFLRQSIRSLLVEWEATDCSVILFGDSALSDQLLLGFQAECRILRLHRIDLTDSGHPGFHQEASRSPQSAKLAIVGMGCRFPGGANNLALFWDLLQAGRDVHTTIPPDRFDLKTHYDPTGQVENASPTQFGNFIDTPGFFDAAFFNMSPREARETDPQHRLALVTAYEALEMAGYVNGRTPASDGKRVAVFYGQAGDDWRELNASQKIGPYAVSGGERSFANGRISYFFNFAGPSYNIDAACSSSLAAVHMACEALRSGKVDTVVAGGLSILTHPDKFAGLGKSGFLSSSGQCKVWDKDADGYCRADGIGSIVIKRLEDAVDDNDRILATILSTATNHCANAISITHPHVGAQKDLYTELMLDVGINPLDVGYVELHGTGTQAGDPVEAESVKAIFAPVGCRPAHQRLYLGSVKCNIGHSEAAAGIASLIKVILMYQHHRIPPHVGIRCEANPALPQDLETCNVGVCLQETLWSKVDGEKRYAVVNNFGAHAGNSAVLLEDAPEMARVGEDPRQVYVVAISAKSRASLSGNIQALVEYMERHPDVLLGDLSYTTCARRTHYKFRIAAAVTSYQELQISLKLHLGKVDKVKQIRTEPPGVVFAFTGQSESYVGISAQLFDKFPFYRTQILQLSSVVQSFGFPSIIPVVTGAIDCQLPDHRSIIQAQLAIFVIELALARLWRHLGVKPIAVVGHSLGEYAALVVAGVLSAGDAIWLVGKRAECLLDTCEVGSFQMLAIQATYPEIQKICDGENYDISCLNGKRSMVISAARETIQIICARLQREGIRFKVLDIPFAFHSRQMERALPEFRKISRSIEFHPPAITVLSPLLGECILAGCSVTPGYLLRALREPVDFISSISAGRRLGVVTPNTIWIDIGPHPICGEHIRRDNPDVTTVSSLYRGEDDFVVMAKSMAKIHCTGVRVRWDEYFRPYEKAHFLLHLPSYRWDEKNYWIPYESTWTLDKARSGNAASESLLTTSRGLQTSLIHRISLEEIHGSRGRVHAISNMAYPDFRHALLAHKVNGCGVTAAGIWSDMCWNIGKYLYRRMIPGDHEVPMNVTKLEVLEAQVAYNNPSTTQLLQIEAVLDTMTMNMGVQFYNVSEQGSRSERYFASATVAFESLASWRAEWREVSSVIKKRIESLTKKGENGEANLLTGALVYSLMKRGFVDIGERDRGIQSFIFDGYEACAAIQLDSYRHGVWHTPPHWVESLTQVASIIMNISEASDVENYYYVSPYYESFRLAEQPIPGAKYTSYTSISPMQTDGNYEGDVYILRESEIIGMVRGIRFRRVPRFLKSELFVAPDISSTLPCAEPQQSHVSSSSKPDATDTVAKWALPFLTLVSEETGQGIGELKDELTLVELGIDSLMALIICAKSRSILNLEIPQGLFLSCDTFGELKKCVAKQWSA